MVCRNIKLLYKYYFVNTQITSTKLNYNLIYMYNGKWIVF